MDCSTIQLPEQVRQILGDDLHHLEFLCLFGGDAGALSHRFLGPFHVAIALLRDRFDVAGCEVFELFFHHFVWLLAACAAAADGNRMRRPNARIWRHRRYI